jgi:hypothetical protein
MILVATASFVDPSDNGWIKAGVTYVDSSADVFRSHPANFKPVSGGRSGLITRLGGSAKLIERKLPYQRPHGLELPELRADAAPSATVKLFPGARREIDAELERSSGILGTHETGGNLFGRLKGGALEVIDGSGPGSDGQARRFEGAVMVSMKEGHEIARELRRNWHDELINLCGGWHVHPRPVREPSEADRENALMALDDLVERHGWRAPPAWVDVILYPVGDGWSAAGWATRRLEWSGQAVTEPVTIEKGA